VVGLAQDAGHDFVVLGHNGHVLVPRDGGLVMLGSLADVAGHEVSHPIGAFTGGDGRARLIDYRRSIACTTPDGLEACGPVVDINPALVHSLGSALIIEDQAVRTQLLTEAGVRKLPLAMPSASGRAFAGVPASPIALSQNTLLRFDGTAWQEIARIPAEWRAESVAAAASAIYVGVRGGGVLQL
jgi:hypothetical protein